MSGKGPAAEDKKMVEREKKEAVVQQIKDKRMVHSMIRLRDIGEELNIGTWGMDFVDNDAVEKYIE